MPRFGLGALLRELVGDVGKLRGLSGERVGAFVHVGDAPRRLARARLPALDLGGDDSLPLAQRGDRAFVRGERIARVRSVGACAVGGALFGIERGARETVVGERGKRCLLLGERFLRLVERRR